MPVDHLQRLRTFVAVAESGSFVGGARRREISAPAATRAVASLERHLGALLLQRTTRSLRLTEAGEAFLGDCRRILGELEAAEAAVTGVRDEPRGALSVTAPALFGSRHIAPLLFEFLDLHPALQARALFTNRLVHLVDEGFDVALRIAVLPDSGLTAVPVGQMRAVIVASPAYLAANGTPRTAADLRGHRAIGLTIEGQQRLGWRLPGGKTARAARAAGRQRQRRQGRGGRGGPGSGPRTRVSGHGRSARRAPARRPRRPGAGACAGAPGVSSRPGRGGQGARVHPVRGATAACVAGAAGVGARAAGVGKGADSGVTGSSVDPS
jgi:DNA-binding transcriptional LysR family regulator